MQSAVRYRNTTFQIIQRSLINKALCLLLQSFRGRKSLKFAATAASPRSQPPAASASPQPASVPQPSPNTNTSSSTGTQAQQNGIGLVANGAPTLANGSAHGGQQPNNQAKNNQMGGQMQHVVHQQQQQQPPPPQQQHIQATTTIHAIKDDTQQPMVSFLVPRFLFSSLIRN